MKPFLGLDPQKGSRWSKWFVHCHRQELRVLVSLHVVMCPDCRHHTCASLLLRLISTSSLMYWLFKNQDVVALRCCISLCSSAKWILCIHPMLFGCPSCWGHTERWAEFPVLHGQFSWVICLTHSSVYLSTPVSQFIPTPPSPLASICLFSTSVSLLLLCK